jgi:nucleotide-binding universal stress UspA family protein
MIKSLLVAWDGSHGSRVALQHAVELARRTEGRIVLLTVGSAPADEAELLNGGGADPLELAAETPVSPEGVAPPETDAALGQALEVCRELTVRCLARPAYGEVPTALATASRFSDLLLIGRDAPADPAAGTRSARTARRLAGLARCPVLITPRQYQPLRSVLAVCPLGMPDVRCVRVASELAQLCQARLGVVVVAREHEATTHTLRDLKRYLVDRGQGVEVTVRKPPATEQIAAAAGDRQSPLIVVPRSRRWAGLTGQDYLGGALQILGASVVVVP